MHNRRNAELFLLGVAALITMVALLIVEANQEQGLRWDLVQYLAAYVALFSGAPLAIRRFAPYADPLLLPIVALLNGLGLVMIHRLDLAAGPWHPARPGAEREPTDAVDAGRRHRLLPCRGLSRRSPILARYGPCSPTGLVLLAISAVLPRSMSEQNGAKI
jgi:cell division protein FtsW